MAAPGSCVIIGGGMTLVLENRMFQQAYYGAVSISLPYRGSGQLEGLLTAEALRRRRRASQRTS